MLNRYQGFLRNCPEISWFLSLPRAGSLWGSSCLCLGLCGPAPVCAGELPNTFDQVYTSLRYFVSESWSAIISPPFLQKRLASSPPPLPWAGLMLNGSVGGGTKSVECDQRLVFSSTTSPFVLCLNCSPASCGASCRDNLIEFPLFWPWAAEQIPCGLWTRASSRDPNVLVLEPLGARW